MSEGQTLRNEDNAFLPLSSTQVSLVREFGQSRKALCQVADKTLKQHAWVSSLLQVRPSLRFNCGIRDERNCFSRRCERACHRGPKPERNAVQNV